MREIARRAFVGASMIVALSAVVMAPGRAAAVDVGQTAPDFKLVSTFGTDISLSEFRGKKWVLIEFYAADFVPA